MQLETFRGQDLSRVLADVRAVFGDDAMILQTRSARVGGGRGVEVVVASEKEVERFRQRLERPAARRPRQTQGRPYVVALVGPTGAGKTTTIAKLALHPAAFGGRRVGILTLDTFRVAALEQIETYAGILGCPLEVVYEPAEVDGALKRLAACEVVLVDTPGRSPKAPAGDQAWRAILRRIDPDEVHFVVPAGIRIDVAQAARATFESCGITHALLTKLDEVPHESGVAELAERLDAPARWVTTGQEVPTDLQPAVPRLLAALCNGAGVEATPAIAV
ncbi:MAG TPA: hypothetical protein VIL13_06585 [Longimicrobiales bacterium]|jgi:flagellar biosynthesis protein FlhF